MYKDYFGFIELPFSIVPSARYLFLSSRHREAMGHLQAGLGEGGGFAMLTGEVGTGKTTVSKAMLASLDENVKAGLILNPTFSESDLLEAICDEFGIGYPQQATLKQLTQAIYQYLLDNHAKGIQTLLLIDEAQHLSTQVLEQLRLLTNLETDTQKLLKVLLVGQPELQQKLQTGELRQLAQRITGRYHLLPLTEKEVAQYIAFRLRTSGCDRALFGSKAIKIIARQTQGVPRLINLICDKALLYTFYSGEAEVSAAQAEKACQDVLSFQAPAPVGQGVKQEKTNLAPVWAAAASVTLLWASYHFAPQIRTATEQQLEAMPVIQSVKRPEPPSVDAELSPFAQQSSSEVEAIQTLYRLWGIKASVLDANCTSEMTHPYYCEKRGGLLADIQRVNRPVVLTLESSGKTFYAVLYAIYGDQVELLNGSQRVRAPLSWLEKAWDGEYQTLWYRRIYKTLRLGSTGEAVRILDQLLATALDEEPLATSRFNAALKKRVKAFQSWQGLVADGVAGKQTLQVLYHITNEKAPVLLNAPVANEGVS